MLVTGDTDLVPAVISGRDRDPGKTLAVHGLSARLQDLATLYGIQDLLPSA